MGTGILRHLAGWFLKYRYLLLSLILLVLMGVRSYNGLWVGDFWEHSSVLRELAARPLHPQHPQLQVDTPHAFYTPYHLAWALFSRFSTVDVIATLELAGIVNLALFLIGLWMFISSLKHNNRDGAAFYSLLLILLLWGARPWNYSGFYHLGTLGWVIPYPSTFAMAMAFIAMAINQQRLDRQRDLLLVPVFLIALVVLLTHQITFIFLALGLLAFSLRAPQGILVDLLKVGLALVLTFALAGSWPYYPFFQLLLGGTNVFHSGNQVMFQDVIFRVWPVLIGLPLLILAIQQNWRQPLIWMFTGLSLVYLFGWLTGAYSYGRVISYIALILQIIIAIFLAQWESKITSAGVPSPPSQAVFSGAILFLLVILTANSQLLPAFQGIALKTDDRYDRFQFLGSYTQRDDVILAPSGLNLFVPTFGGRVVDFDRPLAFVPDQAERKASVARFFTTQDSLVDRMETLKKYGVDYILLEKTESSNWSAMRSLIAPYAELVYRGKRYLLFSVNLAGLQ